MNDIRPIGIKPTARVCDCGSGKPSQWQQDGRGTPRCRTCPDCYVQKMRKYDLIFLNHDTDGSDEAEWQPDPEHPSQRLYDPHRTRRR